MRHSKLLIVGGLLGNLLLAGPAFADIAPVDQADVEGSAGQGNFNYGTGWCGTVEREDDDGGCSMSAVPVGGLAGIAGPLMAFGLALARRRRPRHGRV